MFRQSKVFGIPIVLLVALFSANCRFLNSVSPSSSSTGSTASREAWLLNNGAGAYVGIHPFGACESQKPYLLMMKKSGTLKGVRVGELHDPGISYGCAGWLSSQGIEILGLFENEYLRSPNVTQIFDDEVRRNPFVQVWEIGNEVEGPPGVGANMSVREYTPIFLSLFYYAKTNFPNLKLAPQSDSLSDMLDAGLDKAVKDGLPIITIHFYPEKPTTLPLAGLQQIIATRIPATTQVWITETGIANWSAPGRATQAEFVRDNYGRFSSMLRAVRIYWYVMSECSDFDLVHVQDLPCGRPPQMSPLFLELTDPPTRQGVIR